MLVTYLVDNGFHLQLQHYMVLVETLFPGSEKSKRERERGVLTFFHESDLNLLIMKVMQNLYSSLQTNLIAIYRDTQLQLATYFSGANQEYLEDKMFC